MEQSVNFIIVIIVLLNLFILGSSRIRGLIKNLAFQGILIALFTVIMPHESFRINYIIIASLIFLFKGVIFPILLYRSLAESKITSEIQPYVSFGKSLGFGFVAILMSLWLSSFLTYKIEISRFTIAVALFTILVGLFILVSRKRPVTQVIGYLILENGIFLLSFVLAAKIPLLIELGILLDVFVALLIMSMAVKQINNKFNHTDINYLNSLKG